MAMREPTPDEIIEQQVRLSCAKATAQQRISKRARYATMLVTVGAPNFLERRFIRVCQKAGMCFPLRQVQLKYWSKRK